MSKTINLNFGDSSIKGVKISQDQLTDRDIQTWIPDNHKDFKFHTIKGETIEDKKEYLAVNMDIPGYFGYGEYKGLFIFDAARNQKVFDLSKRFFGVGQWGCAKRLSIDPNFQLTFNNNHFLPFVINDYSVAYYSCEERYYDIWMCDVNRGYTQVSINAPIQYDPAFGIFVTRDVHLISDEMADKYSKAIAH